jgi:hypothetical protein
MTAPYDPVAEASVLAAMVSFPSESIPAVEARLVSSDFYVITHRFAFDALVAAWRKGEPLGITQLGEACRRLGHEPNPVAVADIAGASTVGTNGHVATVLDRRIRRDVLVHATEAREAALDLTLDAADTLDRTRAALGGVDVPVDQLPADVWQLDDFCDRPMTQQSEWVVPGMLRVGWRCMVVAAEGAGKSTLFRQIAVAAAQGIHPLCFRPQEPARSLIVDLENPPDAITEGCNPIRAQARARSTVYDPDRAWLWHRPGGINLRTRSDRASLEAVVQAVRPRLVCLGPMYKAYSVSGPRDNDEQAAGEVQHFLDDLRTRYGFALLLEHHAPKAQGGYRDLMPYGSSLWLRWPELGLKLVRDADMAGSVKVDRWRQDRMECAWPYRLDRGSAWPWAGVWKGSLDDIVPMQAAS